VGEGIRRTIIVCLVVGVTSGAAALAPDPETTARLAEARERFEMVEYEEAAELFLRVAEDPAATEDQRKEAWHLRAVCLAGLDDMAGAEAAFVAVIDLDPDFELGMVSPKVREAYEAAVATVAARPPPEPEPVVEPDPPPPVAGRSSGPSLRTWAMVVGAGGAATLAAGGLVGNSARSGAIRYREAPESFASQSEAHAFAEVIEGRARTANLLFVGGAALTAGALTLFLVDGGPDGGASSPDPRLAVGAWPGGGVVVLGFQW
jgi:hypothetical protein